MPDESLDPGLIHRIGTGFMASGALFAALDLDVFDTLEGTELEAAEVAARLKLDARHIEATQKLAQSPNTKVINNTGVHET
ncbi:MAG: methyltransferase dimerization domain-containing protein [Candidatus Binataceae bacterium]|jgi:hypothetical protein